MYLILAFTQASGHGHISGQALETPVGRNRAPGPESARLGADGQRRSGLGRTLEEIVDPATVVLFAIVEQGEREKGSVEVAPYPRRVRIPV
jgi:hypothetical protein